MTNSAGILPPAYGTPQTAIAVTANAYVNIRSGPAVSYGDLGDLLKHSIVQYYPETRTRDGWVWIEQEGIKGWVLGTLISFEPVTSPTPPPPTPYTGKIAMWHWRGDSVAENSIEEFARRLKERAPNLNQVWVKVSDYTKAAGAQWMGYWDTKRALAIDGTASIDHWAQGLEQHGLEFHAWSVPRGADIEAETRLLIQACTRPGVKSLILDVEPYAGFWLGSRETVRPFMEALRAGLPADFHIGLCVDPRRLHYATIFPEEWQPYINSVHPMVYWASMRWSPEALLRETYAVWGGYGKPIIPALQGDATAESMTSARTLAAQRHSAPGVSWWRVGVISHWNVVNTPLLSTPPRGAVLHAYEQLIKPTDPRFRRYSYTGEEELQEFTGTWGWTSHYKTTETRASKVVARWTPEITASGFYEIAAFVPARHATTRNARYKIHGVRGVSGEIVITVDQMRYRNQWQTLGVFEIDHTVENAGVIMLNDLTGETGRQIAFDAIRARRVIPVAEAPDDAYSDGFDPPVGTIEDRRSREVWGGKWLDASPFGRLYFIGSPKEAYHTGADLNLPGDADAHTTVHAAANGIVTFANTLSTWGNVVIIRHDPIRRGNRVMYGRYAHLDSMVVEPGQRVRRGDPIGIIGDAFGRYAYHLHFDLSPTTILENNPAHWPGKDRATLLSNYVDPKEFIEANRPKEHQ